MISRNTQVNDLDVFISRDLERDSVTAFAVTNDAFVSLPAARAESLPVSANQKQVGTILEFHVVPESPSLVPT